MILSLVGAVSLLLLGQQAPAAGLDVSPVTIDLDASTSNSTVTLKNSADKAKRYQLEMTSWGEAADGKMQLAPTKDLIFFPPLITLKPGESRNVRVGLKSPPGATERTYRLFVQEMPPEHPPGTEKPQIQVLTRIGLPVFVRPTQPHEKAELADLKVESGKASFALKNEGNVHVRPTNIVFTALDAKGQSVFEKTWSGWYVLASGARDYTIDVPADACRKATTFKAEANGERLSISTAVQGNAKACVK